MKKTLSIALAFIFLIVAMPLSVFAADYSATMYDYVVEQLLAQSDQIDVALFFTTSAEVEALMNDIYKNEPELFYLELGYSYSYSGSRILSILPRYAMTSSEIDEATKFVNEKLDAIVVTLPEGLDDAEKALYFHDYICLNFEYDLTYSIYDIYNMLKEDTAVCQGYSLLYDALLKRVGIESHSVTTADHMWNQIKINNKWYHVDVTWDDPVSDLFGRACHDNFMVSDIAIAESHFDENTTSFDAAYISNDTSFDSLSWHNQATPFAFANGNIYCLDDNIVNCMDLYTASHTYVYTITDKWHSANGTYIDCLSGFGSYQNRIIFNTESEIKYLNPTDRSVGTVAVPELPDGNYIYRMYVSGNKSVFMYDTSYSRTGDISQIEIVFADAPAVECTHPSTYEKALSDGATEIRCSSCDELLDTVPAPETHTHDDGYWTTLGDGSKERHCIECGELLETIPAPSPEYLLGDVNADGVIDMFDYLMVKSFYFEVTTPTDDQFIRGDVNEDGFIDMFDYLLVKSIYFNS